MLGTCRQYFLHSYHCVNKLIKFVYLVSYIYTGCLCKTIRSLYSNDDKSVCIQEKSRLALIKGYSWVKSPFVPFVFYFDDAD